MLLNYLYSHFMEEQDFARHCAMTGGELNRLIKSRMFSRPFLCL